MAKTKWIFEPGHTAAEFSVRHMMVSNVRGHFKNVQGTVAIDPNNPTDITVEFKRLKEEITQRLPNFASVYGFGEEPIAFGLKVLIAHIKIPEDHSGALDDIENEIQQIENVSQIQSIMVRKTR